MTSQIQEYATGPQHLITRELLTPALKNDKGSKAQLTSWEVQDFTAKGSHLGCYVTSVVLKYSFNDEMCDVTYILKLNPAYDVPGFERIMTKMFVNEVGFYLKLAPDMDSELALAGLPPLRVPSCLYACKELNQQAIVLEDLRKKGFMTRNLMLGCDVAHASLVLEAIARFHASSFLVMKKHPEEDLASRFEQPTNAPPDSSEKSDVDFFKRMLGSGVECSHALLSHVGGFEKAVQWLDGYRKCSDYRNQKELNLKRSPPFDMICHGDFWTANFLFRYDDNDEPKEAMFVDLQGAKCGSPVRDLNYFFYMSLSPSLKKANKEKFAVTYYEAFEEVVIAGRETMPFSLKEFRQELKENQGSGLLFFMLKVAYMGRQNVDANELFGEKTKGILGDQAQGVISLLKTNPKQLDTIFETFRDATDDGVFD